VDRRHVEQQCLRWRDHVVRPHDRWAHLIDRPGDHVGPGPDADIQRVDDAVAMAESVAASSNWSAVPWEELFKQMLAVAPPAA